MNKSSITHSDLVKLLPTMVKSNTFVTVQTDTEVDLPKKNPLYGLRRNAKRNGQIGFDYGNAVNNRAAKEGLAVDREAKPRKWGTVTPDRLFVEHNGKYYLRLRLFSSTGEDEGLPEFFLHGKALPHHLVCSMLHTFKGSIPVFDGTKTHPSALTTLLECYPEAPENLKELAKATGLITFTEMPAKKTSSTQDGIKNPVIANDIDLHHISSINFKRRKYDLVPNDSPNIPATVSSHVVPLAPVVPVVPIAEEIGEGGEVFLP